METLSGGSRGRDVEGQCCGGRYKEHPRFQEPTNVEGLVPADDLRIHNGKVPVPNVIGLRAFPMGKECRICRYAGQPRVVKTLELVARHYL